MPHLTINLGKIEANTRLVAGMVNPLGVGLVGVTKACLGNPMVAQAMLAGGAAALADARLENIGELRRLFPDAKLILMRSPVAGDRGLPGRRPDLCYVSSAAQAVKLLELWAPEDGAEEILRLCLSVETGDGREGAPAEAAAEEAERIFELDGVELAGLATNAACARMPGSLEDILKSFYEISSRVLWRLGRKGLEARRQQGAGPWPPSPYGKMRPFPVMSVGGSGLLRLLADGDPRMPVRAFTASPLGPVSELRCGEAILLGRIPTGGDEDLFLPEAHRDAFRLTGEVVEIFEKSGELQALLDFGRQDVGTAALIPCEGGITPRAATSDYFAVTVAPDREPPAVGGELMFIPSYHALVAAMTSPFVKKRFTGAG
jgi:predicted amino acid racemase